MQLSVLKWYYVSLCTLTAQHCPPILSLFPLFVEKASAAKMLLEQELGLNFLVNVTLFTEEMRQAYVQKGQASSPLQWRWL